MFSAAGPGVITVWLGLPRESLYVCVCQYMCQRVCVSVSLCELAFGGFLVCTVQSLLKQPATHISHGGGLERAG